MAGLALAAPLHAAALNISPVELQLDGDAPVATLTVSNSASDVVAMEAHVFEWLPDGAGERRVPTKGVIVSPPIFRIGPSGQQILRIAERDRRPASIERAYRVVLTQIPDPEVEGVQIALRFDLPMYVAPQRGEGRLEWRLAIGGGGTELIVANRGAAHVRLMSVRRAEPDKSAIETGPRVILAGGERRWQLDEALPAGGLKIVVRTNQGEEQLVVNPPAR